MDNPICQFPTLSEPVSERTLEEIHLEDTLLKISENLEVLEDEKSELDARINALIQQYNPENVELYNELMVGLSMQSVLNKRVNAHTNAVSRPYFARIDAEYEDEEEYDYEVDAEEARTHQLYIGKNGITDFDGAQLVTDWRAPIASLYYDATPGPASYTAPGGEFEVDLLLKRTYEIEDGQLLDFYDTDVVANDDLLIKYLGKNRSAALSDIVATIQRDQNTIIREDPWKNIIVQGAAGSGKTTVAMHRLAWITYNYRDQFKENEFYIIGGSNMFLKYITAMLPELDVHDVCSMTFAEFLLKLLTDDDNRGFESVVPQPFHGDITLKSSHAFTDALNKWLEELQKAVFEPQELSLNGIPLLSASDVSYILQNRRNMSFAEIADVIAERIEFAGSNSREKMNAAIEARYDEDARAILDDLPERRFETLSEAIKEKNRALSSVRSDLTKLRRCYHRRLPKKPAPTLYRQFLGWLASKDPAWEQTAKRAAANVVKNTPDVIDLCMMLMIQCRLKPLPIAKNVRHLIIDEAQDYGESCYVTLKAALPKCIFTIMGDIAQNISSSGGLENWDALLDGPFNDSRTAFFNLKKSYRNTIEISHFAGRVLSSLPAGRYGVEPVIRHGEEPLVCRCASEAALAEKTSALIREYLADGMHSIAVIARTKAEAEIVHSLLPDELDAVLACSGDDEYTGGITVFPAGMVKGMEYDAVIVWDANEVHYPPETGKLLYVVLTRAMHKLSVLYTDELTSLLIPSQQ
ncbi:MAG: hypothetical protein E7487_10840 [Ruminococcaceae bacterium]|nr:hypothetical protein [Oscillospiraceae bacterium]